MASIAYLDASNRGIKDLTGIEYLTNLVQLNLFKNALPNNASVLNNLKPSRATQGPLVNELVGAANLRSLNLGNIPLPLASIASLPKSLEKLRLGTSETDQTKLANEFVKLQGLNELRYETSASDSIPSNRIVDETSTRNGPGIVTTNPFQIVRNIAPTVTLPAQINGINEGVSQTFISLLQNATISDPADSISTDVTITSPSGVQTQFSQTPKSKAIQLSKDGDGKITAQMSDLLRTKQFTLESLVIATSDSLTPPVNGFVSVIDVSSAQTGFKIQTFKGVDQKVYWSASINGQTIAVATPAALVKPNTVTQVVARYNGSTFSLIVDGKEVKSIAFAGYKPNSGASLQLG